MPDDPQFSDERFMSADKKRKVLRAWRRFLASGCEKSQFTEALYDHLIQHCSFIAHFNRHGFYEVYFGQITDRLFRFFDQFDAEKPGLSAEYGSSHWLSEHNTGADLNHAMREVAGLYLQKLRQEREETRRQAEISAATRVLARYGLAVIPAATLSKTNDETGQLECGQTTNQHQVQLFTEQA